MKRILDLTISVCLLTILIPFILFLSLIVRISLGSPIFFKQQRPGLKGKVFYINKFRTMNCKLDELGKPLSDDLRLTLLGKFMRKYSFDELPQLVNVLKGEMSVVGPRPLLMEYLPLYSCDQARRHNVKPGITGWAQVNGRNAISWEQKFELDVWYVDNQSFWLDLKILWFTVKKVIYSEGISQPGKVTVDKFKGTLHE